MLAASRPIATSIRGKLSGGDRVRDSEQCRVCSCFRVLPQMERYIGQLDCGEWATNEIYIASAMQSEGPLVVGGGHNGTTR